jgi:DNA gyrase subunit A
LRSVSHVEGEDKQSIVVTELPYQVNKAKLITKIAELVKDKKVDGSDG